MPFLSPNQQCQSTLSLIYIICLFFHCPWFLAYRLQMAPNGLICSDVPLRNYSLTLRAIFPGEPRLASCTMTYRYILPFVPTVTSVAQRFKQQTFTRHTWVQHPLVPIRVTGGDRKGIRPNLLQCTSETPTYVGSHVRALEQGSQRR